MIAAYVHDPEHQKKPPRIDYSGIALLAMSVGAMQFVLEHGQREDWFQSHQIVALSLIGVLGWLALMWRGFPSAHPGIDVPGLEDLHRLVGGQLAGGGGGGLSRRSVQPARLVCVV